MAYDETAQRFKAIYSALFVDAQVPSKLIDVLMFCVVVARLCQFEPGIIRNWPRLNRWHLKVHYKSGQCLWRSPNSTSRSP